MTTAAEIIALEEARARLIRFWQGLLEQGQPAEFVAALLEGAVHYEPRLADEIPEAVVLRYESGTTPPTWPSIALLPVTSKLWETRS